jgi:hypothetical protein
LKEEMKETNEIKETSRPVTAPPSTNTNRTWTVATQNVSSNPSVGPTYNQVDPFVRNSSFISGFKTGAYNKTSLKLNENKNEINELMKKKSKSFNSVNDIDRSNSVL